MIEVPADFPDTEEEKLKFDIFRVIKRPAYQGSRKHLRPNPVDLERATKDVRLILGRRGLFDADTDHSISIMDVLEAISLMPTEDAAAILHAPFQFVTQFPGQRKVQHLPRKV